MKKSSRISFIFFILIFSLISVFPLNNFGNRFTLQSTNSHEKIKNSSVINDRYLLERVESFLNYGGVSHFYTEGFATDSEGNYYVGGSFLGDYFLVKYATNGTQLWNRTVNRYSIDYGVVVAIDSDDNIYFTGWSYPGTQSWNVGYVHTFKYNTSGDLLWERVLSSDDSSPTDIAFDSSNNIYICGHTYDFGALGLDFLVVKYDPSGNLIWVNNTGLNGEDRGYAIIFNPVDQMIYSTGISNGRSVLFKWSTDGDLIFYKIWGRENGIGWRLAYVPFLGNIYIVGPRLGFAVVIFDMDGNNFLNISGQDQYVIHITQNNELFMAMQIIENGYYNTVLSKYYLNGTKIWENKIQTPSIDYSQIFAKDINDNIFLLTSNLNLLKYTVDYIPPIINFISPLPYESFGKIRPDFQVITDDFNLETTWYSLSNNTFMTDNYIWSGKIHQNVWEQFGNGNITINIYANDFNGNHGFNNITVIKDLSIKLYWNLTGSTIFIDDLDIDFNWYKIDQENPWCYGLGTQENPYVIENILLDGMGIDNCIEIRNSNKYFIIKNSTILNAGLEYDSVALLFVNVSNGLIINNTMSLSYKGIGLSSSDFIHMENNTLNYNMYGFYGSYSENLTISQNLIHDNSLSGISINNCDNNTINLNYLNNNQGGISLASSHKNLIRNNIIFNNFDGIHLSYSNNNTIKNNTLNFNDEGIFLYRSDNNSLEENVIKFNKYGIKINSRFSIRNIVKGNVISHNTELGLYIYGKYYHSHDNLIFNNTFMSNLENALDEVLNNSWDNAVIGNFWDDYNGKDINDNGIGDSAYNIGTGVDNFPLWWDPPVLSIVSEKNNLIFGFLTPEFRIMVEEGIADTIWYTCNNGISNYTIYANELINPIVWENLGNGSFIFNFYVNDSRGDEGNIEVVILKDIILPSISLKSPNSSQVFGHSPPDYDIIINESNIGKIWYSLNNNENITIETTNGRIDYAQWDLLPDGEVIIRFYANDSAGNIGFSEVLVIKSTQNNNIPGYHLWILLSLFCTVSFLLSSIILRNRFEQ
ncbi:hypothetical protein LCGC14_0437770 [marine sediment metagenome]|uniref:Uncharacterized protein n=1 Tax=marine sediment metagenome TaxID=412755 RepID=A0A0F9VVH8_9ZZZZ